MVPNDALSYILTWKIRTLIIRTIFVGPKVSIIRKFHCTQLSYPYINMSMYYFNQIATHDQYNSNAIRNSPIGKFLPKNPLNELICFVCWSSQAGNYLYSPTD